MIGPYGKGARVMKSSLKTMGMLSILCMILLSVFLSACGGGGGGDGDEPAGISYTGVTTPAEIDESNAQDLATGAYQGGSTAGSAGGAAGGLGAVQTAGTEGTGSPRTLKVSLALEDSLRRVDLMSRSGGISLGAVYEESDTVYGDCGGSASYTITVNDVTGEFSGRFNYGDYCSQGVTLSGGVSFSGEVDVDTGDFLSFTFSFNNLTATSGSDSFTLRGDISYDVNDSSISVSMDMLLEDNNTRKVYWARDCTMTWTEGAGYVEFEWSGRYYDPDEGYVIVSTDTPFRVYDGENWPSEGILVVTGDGSTKARLTVLTSTTFQVEADTDGDGSYDWDSEVLYWSDF
jgi:hypothetical protein